MLGLISAIVMMSSVESEGVMVDAKPGVARMEGRWEWSEEGARGQWPGVGFDIRFRGDELGLVVEDSASGKEHKVKGHLSNYLAYRFTGEEWKTLRLKPGKHEYVLKGGMGRENLLEVRKRTESSLGAITWHGVRLREGAELLPAHEKRMVLTVYGDSNSAGYGVEAAGKEEDFSPFTENATLAFAFLSAEDLEMDLDLVAASGWGIYRGYGADTYHQIPRVWKRAFWEEDSEFVGFRQPEVILVVLGSNDFAKGDPGVVYDESYLAFVKALRAKSPEALIVLGVSSTLKDSKVNKKRSRTIGVIERIIERTGDERILKFEFDPYVSSDGYGADWHVSRAGHERMRVKLTSFLKGLRKEDGGFD